MAGSGEKIKKITSPHRQGLGKLSYILQTDVPFAPLDATDIVAMKTSSFG
jgi:hypothetical protein